MPDLNEFWGGLGTYDSLIGLAIDSAEMGKGCVSYVNHWHLDLGESWELAHHELIDDLFRSERGFDEDRTDDEAGVDRDHLKSFGFWEFGMEVPCCSFCHDLGLVIDRGVLAWLEPVGLVEDLFVLGGIEDGHDTGCDDESLDFVLVAGVEDSLGAFDCRVDDVRFSLGVSSWKGRSGVNDYVSSFDRSIE